MKILKSVLEAKELLSPLEKSVGLVPTMGALHRGHGELIKKSKQENEVTVLSLFVNPKQFNESQDFTSYPQTWDTDKSLLEALEVDYVFMPEVNEIYKPEDHIVVSDSVESRIIEGEHRPGHFDGVLTVVLKLFNIIQPTHAYFGEKDFQQLRLIQSMVKALFLDVEIRPVELVRDEEGLPFSSRNLKLSEEGLSKARKLAKVFQESESKREFLRAVKNVDAKIEYVEEKWGRLLTVYNVEGIRILDNKPLELNVSTHQQKEEL